MKTEQAQQSSVLPQDSDAAVKLMLEITDQLIAACQEETNAVAMADDLAFLQATQNKQQKNDLYQKAAAEFMGRTPEFQGKIEHALLDQLTEKQNKLREEAQINMSFLEPIKKEKS